MRLWVSTSSPAEEPSAKRASTDGSLPTRLQVNGVPTDIMYLMIATGCFSEDAVEWLNDNSEHDLQAMAQKSKDTDPEVVWRDTLDPAGSCIVPAPKWSMGDDWEQSILWQDNLKSQLDKGYRERLETGAGTMCEYFPPEMTDIVQPVDHPRVGNNLKYRLNCARSTALEKSLSSFDEWEAMSASQKRITYTWWCGDIWDEVQKDDGTMLAWKEVFEHLALTLAADGTQDHCLKLKALPGHEFPKTRPPVPPKKYV